MAVVLWEIPGARLYAIRKAMLSPSPTRISVDVLLTGFNPACVFDCNAVVTVGAPLWEPGQKSDFHRSRGLSPSYRRKEFGPCKKRGGIAVLISNNPNACTVGRIDYFHRINKLPE